MKFSVSAYAKARRIRINNFLNLIFNALIVKSLINKINVFFAISAFFAIDTIITVSAFFAVSAFFTI